MESDEKYPGVCTPYLWSIDHSCWKFRTLEGRKKARHVPEIMKDIVASSFLIYRSNHSYWIFRTKEEKATTRRRPRELCYTLVSAFLDTVESFALFLRPAIKLLISWDYSLQSKEEELSWTETRQRWRAMRTWKIAVSETKSDERFLHPFLLETSNMRREIVHINEVSGRKHDRVGEVYSDSNGWERGGRGVTAFGVEND